MPTAKKRVAKVAPVEVPGPKEIFKCTAEHYKGDKPHYWYVTEAGYQRRYWPEKGKRVKSTKVLCEDHLPPTVMSPEILLAGLKLEGFEGFIGADHWGQEVYPTFRYVNSQAGVSFKMVFSNEPVTPTSYSQHATGHTTFTTAKGERTFDRTGVEDSFYVCIQDDVARVQAKLEKQLVRIEESRARIATAVTVPGIGYMIQPDQKEVIAAQLRAGKSYSFTPSGFGTGYRLYGGRPQSRWDKRAKAETEAFFGVSPLFIQTMDCD